MDYVIGFVTAAMVEMRYGTREAKMPLVAI